MTDSLAPLPQEVLTTATLLPCPFGCEIAPRLSFSQGESLWSHSIVTWSHISCSECDVLMQECDDRDGAKVVERWNRRLSSPEGSAQSENSVRTSEVEPSHGEHMSEPRERTEFYRKLNAAIDRYASAVRGPNHAGAAKAMDAALDEAEREYGRLVVVEGSVALMIRGRYRDGQWYLDDLPRPYPDVPHLLEAYIQLRDDLQGPLGASPEGSDTKRLNWLDANRPRVGLGEEGEARLFARTAFGEMLGEGPTLREAIDAAMSQSSQGNANG